MKIFILIGLLICLAFANSTHEYGIVIEKEKQIMPLFKDIDILRGKLLILEKNNILETYGLDFEEMLINNIISNPNLIKDKR